MLPIIWMGLVLVLVFFLVIFLFECGLVVSVLFIIWLFVDVFDTLFFLFCCCFVFVILFFLFFFWV